MVVRFVMSVCVRSSNRVKELSCHRTNFHEVEYLSISGKSVEKIKFSWISDKNNGNFTRRFKYIRDSTCDSTCDYIRDSTYVTVHMWQYMWLHTWQYIC